MKNDFDSLQNHFNSRGRHFNCVIKSKEIDIAILRRKLRQKELLYFQETSKVIQKTIITLIYNTS